MHVSIDEPGQQTSIRAEVDNLCPSGGGAPLVSRSLILPSWMTTVAWPSVRSPSNTCPARRTSI
jgi:hypothetical protein